MYSLELPRYTLLNRTGITTEEQRINYKKHVKVFFDVALCDF